jgi:hypothetical protein
MMKRYGRISAHLSKHSLARISAEFAGVYLLAGCIMGFLYWILGTILPQTVFSFNHGPLCLTQAIYFSFIAQFTGGYGDIVPVGFAQTVAVIQSTAGVIFGGLWAGVVVAKWFTSGDRESILLADWAGYSLAEERFFVLFVNRNAEDLVDTNINAIVKLARYNPVPPGVNAPYIGKSAWTFGLGRVPIAEIAQLRLEPGDGVKISISGTAGMTRCTTWKKYTLDQVYVVPNRDYFRDDVFEDPKFDETFFANFREPRLLDAILFNQFDFQGEAKRRAALQQAAPADS